MCVCLQTFRERKTEISRAQRRERSADHLPIQRVRKRRRPIDALSGDRNQTAALGVIG